MAYHITTEEFIKRARAKHGDKYDYSKSEYVSTKLRVEIICPEHGSFWQQPNHHATGQGCPHCGKKRKGFDTSKFIEIAKAKHGDKYDYSKVVYVNNKLPVIIICPIHGEQSIVPTVHLYGTGCAACSMEAKKLTAEEFIRRTALVHPMRCDYSRVVMHGLEEPVEIVCPDHGVFWRSPKFHLRTDKECPKCGVNEYDQCTVSEMNKLLNSWR